MNVADFSFATELFILVFCSFCWLFSSAPQRRIQIAPTRSIRYFDRVRLSNNVRIEEDASCRKETLKNQVTSQP
jgi:hypothetical protein